MSNRLEFKGNASKTSIIEGYEELIDKLEAQEVPTEDLEAKKENEQLKKQLEELEAKLNTSVESQEAIQDDKEVLGYIGIIKGKAGRWSVRTALENDSKIVERKLSGFDNDKKIVEVK